MASNITPTMKAVVVHAPHRASVETVPYPVPGPGEVTIQVKACGICGTDYHIFEGEFLSPYPIIPGHEFSGVVHELGDGVSELAVGDRVTVDPTLYCGSCDRCLTNRFNQCRNWGALGNTTDGAMAEFVKVPVKNVVKIPDTMSYGEGAFIEPVACVVHGMNRLQVQVGDRILLFGAGAMGLQLVQALAHAGASELVVVDVDQKKLDLALSMGATRGVLASEAPAILTEAYPDGFDVVVDVTGIPQVIEQEFNYMGPTAKFLQFGVAPQTSAIQVNPFRVYNKDWTIIGSMAINNTFIPAFRWVKEGRIQVKPLITHTVALEEVPALLARPKDPNVLKAQIVL
ncbi:zinc-dependent alcohol dehydrogenase family protein [Alicyclobacillus kakegawensis]|uniref:zinc-dependent alcohol dehydrogenase family protein n=1 Tax=Alicyclobacillus kakegawensis TaxID=392012 RepID=UPI0008326CB9|nr:zinc-dependent alcohol dehydrogenase family protein [Alicyclobacillus kakegawensis]